MHGANFDATSVVEFGANADTGAGGTPAKTVTFVDANTLVVVTPAHSGGVHTVLVRDADTGQASVLPSAFTFRSSGGGGACSIAPAGERGGPSGRDAALSLAWFALVLGAAWARTRSLRRADG